MAITGSPYKPIAKSASCQRILNGPATISAIFWPSIALLAHRQEAQNLNLCFVLSSHLSIAVSGPEIGRSIVLSENNEIVGL